MICVENNLTICIGPIEKNSILGSEESLKILLGWANKKLLETQQKEKIAAAVPEVNEPSLQSIEAESVQKQEEAKTSIQQQQPQTAIAVHGPTVVHIERVFVYAAIVVMVLSLLFNVYHVFLR